MQSAKCKVQNGNAKAKFFLNIILFEFKFCILRFDFCIYVICIGFSVSPGLKIL